MLSSPPTFHQPAAAAPAPARPDGAALAPFPSPSPTSASRQPDRSPGRLDPAALQLQQFSTVSFDRRAATADLSPARCGRSPRPPARPCRPRLHTPHEARFLSGARAMPPTKTRSSLPPTTSHRTPQTATRPPPLECARLPWRGTAHDAGGRATGGGCRPYGGGLPTLRLRGVTLRGGADSTRRPRPRCRIWR